MTFLQVIRLLDVECRPVCVHSGHRRLHVPVGHEVFGGDDSLVDPIGRSGAMTADAEDALASIRVSDSEYRVPIGPEWSDLVDRCARSLKICEFPTREFRHRISLLRCFGERNLTQANGE